MVMRMQDDWYYFKIAFAIVLVLGLAGFLVYWFAIRKPPPPPGPPPAPPPVDMCSFEGEDLLGNHVYSSVDGTLFTGDSDTQVPCSNCNQYVYKTTEDQRCVPMSYSERQGKVCMAGLGASQPCPVEKQKTS